MVITANDMRLLSQHGTAWTARVTRGQGFWSITVRGSHQPQVEHEYQGVVTRTGEIRQWRTLDALYNWCSNYGVSLMNIDVDRAIFVDTMNQKQQPLTLPKVAKRQR